MAYFDNAATTFPKPDCVYRFIERAVEMSAEGNMIWHSQRRVW